LQYLVGTGRHHGFESLAEPRLLLSLDFLGVDELGAPWVLQRGGWTRRWLDRTDPILIGK
jgi:hypothetical protein